MKTIYLIIFTSILFSKDLKFPNIESFSLENGMKVLVLPDYKKPIVNYFLSINRDNDDNETDHDIMDNFIGVPSRSFSTKFSKLGVTYRFFEPFNSGNIGINPDILNPDNPDWSTLGYVNNDIALNYTFLKEDADKGLKLIYDMVSNTETNYVKNKLIKTSLDILYVVTDPIFIILDLFIPDSKPKKESIYTDHIDHIFTNQTFKDYIYYFPKSARIKINERQKIFNPKNMTLFVTGDVNVLYLKKILNDTFEKWDNKTEPYSKKIFNKKIANDSGIKLRFVDTKTGRKLKNTSILGLVLQGTDDHNPRLNKFASKMASDILVYSDTHFKNREAYESYSVNKNFFADRWNKLIFSIHVPDSVSLLNTYNSFYNDLRNITNIPITKEDLDYQKNYTKKLLERIYSNKEQFSLFITSHLNAGFSLEEMKDYWNNYNNLTIEDVNNAANELFKLENFYIVTIGDKKKSKSFIDNFDNVELFNYKDNLNKKP